jgi:ribosomal-protein-alanine N-acetyltransferase
VTSIETERLIIREMDSATDAEFIFELLNTPKFIKYIGDRGVSNVDEAAVFIDEKYRQSYRDNGYGLLVVVTKDAGLPIGICGLVRRPTLPGPDLGFAFLPHFEKQGFGIESATAMLVHARETLQLDTIFAITTLDNASSIRLLEKLGFLFSGLIDSPEKETLQLYRNELADAAMTS